jgi:hypothetical protein
MPGKQAAEQFWKWFSGNNSKFLFATEVDAAERDRMMAEFGNELHKYHPNLYFLLGGHPDHKDVELIITAEGISEYFPFVEELVSMAPAINGWRVIAFKPPLGKGLSVEIGGRTFDPGKTIFIPLRNEEAPQGVGLRICYPDYEEHKKNLFLQGTYIMLDTLLGERSTTLDIDYLEVDRTPPDIAQHPFMHLEDIKEHIDKVKGRN